MISFCRCSVKTLFTIGYNTFVTICIMYILAHLIRIQLISMMKVRKLTKRKKVIVSSGPKHMLTCCKCVMYMCDASLYRPNIKKSHVNLVLVFHFIIKYNQSGTNTLTCGLVAGSRNTSSYFRSPVSGMNNVCNETFPLRLGELYARK